MRPTIDKNKIASLSSANEMLDQKYGKTGTSTRDAFEAKAKARYYAEVLRDARKAVGMTQQELANKIGKKREYVASLEKGETDMQLSTFIQISEAVGLKFALTY
jgi:HTH-type transcriptional regulator/antitoxin HipB